MRNGRSDGAAPRREVLLPRLREGLIFQTCTCNAVGRTPAGGYNGAVDTRRGIGGYSGRRHCRGQPADRTRARSPVMKPSRLTWALLVAVAVVAPARADDARAPEPTVVVRLKSFD